MSTRVDIFIGTIFIGKSASYLDSTASFGCGNSAPNSISSTGVVSNWSPISSSQIKLISSAYISGIRTEATSLQVSPTISFNPSNGQVTVSLQLSASIEFVQITYIIILNTIAPLTVSSFPGTSNSGFDYFFTGVTVISGSFSFVSIGISNPQIPCVGSSCPGPKVTPAQCTNLGGYIYSQTCYICSGGQIWSGSACSCDDYSIFYNGQCVTCGPNSFPSGNNCQCSDGYTQSGFNNCVPQCSYGSTSDGMGGCICNIAGQVYDPTSGCSCPNNLILNPSQNQCICSVNQILVGGNFCQTCPPNSIPSQNGNTCVCNRGFVLNSNGDGTCVTPPIVCPSGFILNAAKTGCICKNTNSIIVGNTCYSCGNFGTANPVTNKCSCRSGYVYCPTKGCLQYTPPKTQITYLQNVCTSNRYIQAVYIANLPSYFIQNIYTTFNLININVLTPGVNPNVIVNYLPSNPGVFILQFSLTTIQTASFQYSINFNPQFSQYFNSGDLSQQPVYTCTPKIYNKKSEPTKTTNAVYQYSTSTNLGALDLNAPQPPADLKMINLDPTWISTLTKKK